MGSGNSSRSGGEGGSDGEGGSNMSSGSSGVGERNTDEGGSGGSSGGDTMVEAMVVVVAHLEIVREKVGYCWSVPRIY